MERKSEPQRVRRVGESRGLKHGGAISPLVSSWFLIVEPSRVRLGYSFGAAVLFNFIPLSGHLLQTCWLAAYVRAGSFRSRRPVTSADVWITPKPVLDSDNDLCRRQAAINHSYPRHFGAHPRRERHFPRFLPHSVNIMYSRSLPYWLRLALHEAGRSDEARSTNVHTMITMSISGCASRARTCNSVTVTINNQPSIHVFRL